MGVASIASTSTRRNVSMDETRRKHSPGLATRSGTNLEDDDIPPVPPPKSFQRRSVPARLSFRDVMTRGVEAQQRRTKQKVDLSARYIEEEIAAHPQHALDNRLLTRLEGQIDRLLRAVEDIPCHHDWKQEKGRHICDGCYRIGFLLSVSQFHHTSTNSSNCSHFLGMFPVYRPCMHEVPAEPIVMLSIASR